MVNEWWWLVIHSQTPPHQTLVLLPEGRVRLLRTYFFFVIIYCVLLFYVFSIMFTHVSGGRYRLCVLLFSVWILRVQQQGASQASLFFVVRSLCQYVCTNSGTLTNEGEQRAKKNILSDRGLSVCLSLSISFPLSAFFVSCVLFSLVFWLPTPPQLRHLVIVDHRCRI